jgi:hypothetical protein
MQFDLLLLLLLLFRLLLQQHTNRFDVLRSRCNTAGLLPCSQLMLESTQCLVVSTTANVVVLEWVGGWLVGLTQLQHPWPISFATTVEFARAI